MTLNQVYQRLQDIAENHKQINHYSNTDIMQWLINGGFNYPACFVDLQGAVLKRTERQTQYNFRIWVCDKLNISQDARSNVDEVTSDLMSIAEDLAAMIHSSVFQDDWTPNEDFAVSIAEEQLTDYVVSIYFDCTIGVDFISDRCQVPNRSNIYTES